MNHISTNSAESTWAVARPHTVLLVEDEDIVRLVLEEMLQRLGYHVITAQDGYQAWEQFSQNPEEIDLVVFDLSMPGMNGDILFTHLKEAAPGLKTVLTSGFTDGLPLADLRSRGLSGFLAKPFTMKQVRETMQQLFPE